jgi:hypothetical protein
MSRTVGRSLADGSETPTASPERSWVMYPRPAATAIPQARIGQNRPMTSYTVVSGTGTSSGGGSAPLGYPALLDGFNVTQENREPSIIPSHT